MQQGSYITLQQKITALADAVLLARAVQGINVRL